jgi:nitrite reductase/ring-hydroxylating ferredoxin subunit
METCHVADDNQLFLCKTGDLAPGSVLKVERPEGALAVYNLDGEFFATDDRCTHGLASLSAGEIVDGEIECNMHFGTFDIKTGEPRQSPCSVAIKTYKVEVRGDDVFAIIA